jgi:hypothetical protein
VTDGGGQPTGDSGGVGKPHGGAIAEAHRRHSSSPTGLRFHLRFFLRAQNGMVSPPRGSWGGARQYNHSNKLWSWQQGTPRDGKKSGLAQTGAVELVEGCRGIDPT